MTLPDKRGPTFQEAADYAASRGVVLPEVYYSGLVGIQRSQSVTIAGLASMAQIKWIIDLVRSVMDSGGTFKDFQSQVEAGDLDPMLSRARLDNIFRTNIQAAYSRGRYQQQINNSVNRPYWMYDAINDSRVRPAHLAMDNTILHYTDPWWKTHYTPNGYQCRCTIVSLTETQARKRGISARPPEGADPDEGWDYSVGEDYASPVNAALSDFTTNDTASARHEAEAKRRIREARDAAGSTQEGPEKPE